jgi:hypothetical protein
MPQSRELTIHIEDKPGALGNSCGPLAGRGVNIVAFQVYEWEGKSLIRMVVDDPTTAKALFEANRIYYTETEVAQVRLAHRPGQLSRAASLLGKAQININYAYSGTELGSKMPLVIFGVTDVAKAATLLDKFAQEEVAKIA